MKILAAVVTYNRKALLERCVDHIRDQSRPPDELLVINNDSRDGTAAMLESKNIRCLTQPNLGSAGGWARAIEQAISGGFDAVWLMDDDGYPDADALRILEPLLERGTSCVSSVVLREHQPSHFVFPFPVLDCAGLPVTLGWHRKIATINEMTQFVEGKLYPFAHLFNGALVSVGAAQSVGNVACDYFMFGDEVDYFMRLRTVGRVVSHLDAHHYHPDVTSRPLTQEKIYYYVKNTIVLNGRYFNQKALRNLMAVVAVLMRTAKRNSSLVALSYLFGRKTPLLARAITRGLRGQLGADFDA